MYSADKPHKIMEDKKWWSDEWNPFEYGREYDFSKPFFDQFDKLTKEVPLPHLQREYATMIHSEYCNAAAGLKNCYLVTNADMVENCAYGEMVQRTRDCQDVVFTYDSELCYEGTSLQHCYRTVFSQDCENCRDVWFSLDCFDCNDCFGCVNLRKKSYCIFNKQYTKEEYHKKIEEFELGSRNGVQSVCQKTKDFSALFPRKFMHGRLNTDVSGEYVYQSKNAKNMYNCHKTENCKYCHFLKYVTTGTSDSYDYTIFGNTADLIYESVWCGIQVSNLKFCFWNYNAQDLQYCIGCHNSRQLFGCVGLRKKQYCILNKQYPKDKYEKMIPKIIAHMSDMPYEDKKKRVYKYGEFFPPEMSPFGYNETWAHTYFPLSKEEALESGFSWYNREDRNYAITLKVRDVPDTIKEVNDNIVNEIIECEHRGECNENCATAFKVIPAELQFYRRLNLPLPILCPNCRRHQRLKKLNPIESHERRCGCAGTQSKNNLYQNTANHSHHRDNPCFTTFQTSYAPDRQEIVYCEQCYNAEVV